SRRTHSAADSGRRSLARRASPAMPMAGAQDIMRIIRYEPHSDADLADNARRRASYNPPHYVERLTGQPPG
ncbi:hypothetical protein, partial [Dickeya chrysanthemi]|uniref:hypothetical protein n=1 Tax=Dickeya chrysanthemi TaxID=556 RepID=UPI00301B15C3